MLVKENIKPLGSMILYEPVVDDRKTEGGLFLPGDNDADTLVVGKVLRVGPDVAPVGFSDKILLSRGVSTKVPLGDAACRDFVCLVDQKYVLAIVN